MIVRDMKKQKGNFKVKLGGIKMIMEIYLTCVKLQ